MIRYNSNFTKALRFLTTPIGVLSKLTFFCLLLITLSYTGSSNITYFFLAWNLFLAWVPLVFATLWENRLSHGTLKKWKAVAMFCLWLLFFPNAPYLITDLVHLNNRFNPAIWADTLLLFSCAFTGLVVGIYSLHIIHRVLILLIPRFMSWAIIVASIILSGFGIYLGRVQRWNSWDLFFDPVTLLTDAFYQLGNPQAMKMTIGFSVLLFIVYFMFKTVIHHERIRR